jgi:hypothetical protein
LEGVDVLFGLPPIAFDMFLLFCINEGNQKTLQQLAVHVVDLSPKWPRGKSLSPKCAAARLSFLE